MYSVVFYLIFQTLYTLYTGKTLLQIRIAQDNGVVLIQVFNMGGQLRARVRVLFLRCLIDQRFMIQRVLLHRFDLEQISPYRILNDPGIYSTLPMISPLSTTMLAPATASAPSGSTSSGMEK